MDRKLLADLRFCIGFSVDFCLGFSFEFAPVGLIETSADDRVDHLVED